MVLTCASLLASCGAGPAPAGGEGGLEKYPFEGVSDWRNYADAVATVQVARTEAVYDHGGDPESGRYVLKRAEVRVEHVLWTRGTEIPEILVLDVPGWVQSHEGGALRPDPRTGAWVEGQTLVVALVDDYGGLQLYNQSSVFVVSGGHIRTVVDDRAARALEGNTIQSLESLVRATQPDLVAERYADRPPLERMARVERAKRGLDPDAPLDLGGTATTSAPTATTN